MSQHDRKALLRKLSVSQGDPSEGGWGVVDLWDGFIKGSDNSRQVPRPTFPAICDREEISWQTPRKAKIDPFTFCCQLVLLPTCMLRKHKVESQAFTFPSDLVCLR